MIYNISRVMTTRLQADGTYRACCTFTVEDATFPTAEVAMAFMDALAKLATEIDAEKGCREK